VESGLWQSSQTLTDFHLNICETLRVASDLSMKSGKTQTVTKGKTSNDITKHAVFWIFPRKNSQLQKKLSWLWFGWDSSVCLSRIVYLYAFFSSLSLSFSDSLIPIPFVTRYMLMFFC
jgi:hypothetical protein